MVCQTAVSYILAFVKTGKQQTMTQQKIINMYAKII